MIVGNVDFTEQREHLLQSLEQAEAQVRLAVHDLTDAAESKLDLRTPIKRFPLSWTIGAFLVGMWLGSRRRIDESGRGRTR